MPGQSAWESVPLERFGVSCLEVSKEKTKSVRRF